jgi:hypothetical protein
LEILFGIVCKQVNKEEKEKEKKENTYLLTWQSTGRRPALPRWSLGRTEWAAAAFRSSAHDTEWAGPASLRQAARPLMVADRWGPVVGRLPPSVKTPDSEPKLLTSVDFAISGKSYPNTANRSYK